ncbi:MAG: hypothetical protein ABWY57_04955 [Mycetocola sp.]
MTHDTNDNDPLSDFSVPQDADLVADDAAGDTSESVTEDPGEQADRVAEDPSVTADSPAEAEELTPEPGA